MESRLRRKAEEEIWGRNWGGRLGRIFGRKTWDDGRQGQNADGEGSRQASGIRPGERSASWGRGGR